MRFDSSKAIWLTWYSHRRTSGICDAWGVKLEVIGSQHGGMLGWIHKGYQTLRILRNIDPEVLFVQNPSLGLTILAILCRPFFGYFLVVDAHNEGVRPFVRSGWFVRLLVCWLLRYADRTIVTNPYLAREVTEVGGRALILPDPLPKPIPPSQGNTHAEKPNFDVVVICTYAPDEPISEILSAAKLLPDKTFACTGNHEKFQRLGLSEPTNVHFSGFLPDNDYWSLLFSADVICDLTVMPDCLVCGAYEALAVARPMVLSFNSATQELFGSVAILTDESPSAIAGALREALEREPELSEKAWKEAHAYEIKWKSQSENCLEILNSEISGHTAT